jgi:hypothetical protein
MNRYLAAGVALCLLGFAAPHSGEPIARNCFGEAPLIRIAAICRPALKVWIAKDGHDVVMRALMKQVTLEAFSK